MATGGRRLGLSESGSSRWAASSAQFTIQRIPSARGFQVVKWCQSATRKNVVVGDHGRDNHVRTESCWNDCLKEKKQNTIRPCVPSHVAYEVGAGQQQTVRSPRTMYPYPQKGSIGTARRRCIC